MNKLGTEWEQQEKIMDLYVKVIRIKDGRYNGFFFSKVLKENLNQFLVWDDGEHCEVEEVEPHFQWVDYGNEALGADSKWHSLVTPIPSNKIPCGRKWWLV